MQVYILFDLLGIRYKSCLKPFPVVHTRLDRAHNVTEQSSFLAGKSPAAAPAPLSSPVSKEDKKKKAPKKSHHWLSRRKADHNRCEMFPAQYNSPLYGRRWRRADTNVVAVKFDQLTAPSKMHTGDPVRCTGCEAVLSKLSRLTGTGNNDQTWVCEFCATRNEVDIMLEEVPIQEDVTYMLMPAPSTTASGRSGMDESLVVFVVDTSGSMCVTTEVRLD